MIFKTFDSDIDKISAKWGIFGKSFNEIGTAITGRISDINKGFQTTDDLLGAFKDTDSIWERLYPSKETIQSQLIDVDSVIPKIDSDNFDFDNWINGLNEVDKKVKANKMSWQDFSNSLDDNQKWIAKWGEETQGTIRTQEGLIKANEGARQSALAHNAALKQQTLGAKAASVAMKALSVAGNMLVFALVTKGFELAVKAVDDYVHRLDNAKEQLHEANEELSSVNTELDNVNGQIDAILAKDKIEIVDENELKKLREEVGLLEEKKTLLEAQEYEKQQETNRLISEKYNKNFTTAITTTPDGSVVEKDALSYFEELYRQAEKYALSENPLTDEDKMNFESIKNGAVDLGLQLTELLEDFKPLTAEEEKQKEAMEAMLHYATQISEMYAGTSYEIGERLIEKFATGTDVNSNKLITDWINSLTDEEKRIMVQCDLDEASLTDLKKYLEEQTVEVGVTVASDENSVFTLTEDLSKEIDNFHSKINTLSSALEKELSGTMTDTDLSKLLQEFPELEGQTDNLVVALRALINGELSALLSLLGSDAPDDFVNSLKGSAEEAINFAGNVNKLQGDLDTLKSTLEDVQNGKEYSSEQMAELINKYGDLDKAVIELANGGYSIEEDALKDLINKKIEESNTAISAQIEMTEKTIAEIRKRIEAYNLEKEALAGFGNMASLINSGKEGTAMDIYGSEAVMEYQMLQDEQVYLEKQLEKLNGLYKDNASLKTSIGSSSSTSKETKESFDWVETTLSRIQRTITNLGKVVSDTYRKWSTRNNALAQEIQAVNQEIALQQSAYDSYMSKANSVGLSDHYKSLVMNGGLNIEDIADDALKEQIKDFKTYYEKALDASDAIEDLRANIAELAKTKFDNLSAQYDAEIAMIEHHTNMLDEFVAQSESAGYMASKVYYEAMAEKQNENVELLQNKFSSLLSEFDNAVKTNSIEKFSEDWYNMLGDINDVEQALQDATSQLIEYNQAMQQLSWDAFERIQDYTNNINDEANFLIDILDGYDLHNDTGSLTDHGLSVQGLHAMNYNVYMEQAAMYADEIAKIEKEMASDPYDTELIDRRNELLELQQATIQNAIGEKEAIVDLISNGYDKMLSSLDELIEKRKSALQAEKDLYDYQNSIEEKSTKVSNFKKQIESYKNDTSEAGRATLQKLYVSLESAEKSLEESEYEKYISDQQQLLDSFASETELWINTRLDNLDGLVAEAVSATNKNATTISNAINSASSAFGYQLSSKMEEIWGRNDSGINGIKYVVSIYGDVLYGIMQTVDGDINTARDVLAQHIGNSDVTIGARIDENGNVISTSISNGMALINGNFVDIVDGDKTINSSILDGTTSVCTALDGIKNEITTMIEKLDELAQKNTESIASAQNQVASNQPSNTIPSGSQTTNTGNVPKKDNNTEDRSYSVKDMDTGSICASGLTKDECTTWASSHNYNIVSWNGKVAEVRYKGKTTQSSSSSGNKSTTTTGNTSKEKKYTVLDKKTKAVVKTDLSYVAATGMCKANTKWMAVEMDNPQKVVAYKSGTDNAKRGFHLVSDGNGDEIILTNDGNAVLAKGMQLFPFEGGETVFDANKTAELLEGSLVPLNMEKMWSNITKVPSLPDISKISNRNSNNVNQNINVNFDLPNVTDANSLLTELQSSNRFEKIVKSIAFDELAGGNSLSKYKH